MLLDLNRYSLTVFGHEAKALTKLALPMMLAQIAAVGVELVKGTEDISSLPEIAKHADWYRMLRAKYNNLTEETVMPILQQETGLVFRQVLLHAGVFKRDAQGLTAFDAFVAAVSAR